MAVVVELTAKEFKLLQLLREAADGENKVAAGANKISAAAAKAERDMNRFVEQSKRLVATPMEKYAAVMEKARDALNQSKINAEEYNRIVAQAAPPKALTDAEIAASNAAEAQGRANAQLDAFVQKTKQGLKTELHLYNEELARLKEGLDAGKFTQEEYAEAVAKTKRPLTDAEKKQEELNRELTEFARRTREVNATPMEKYEAAVSKAKASVDGIVFTEADLNREIERQKKILDNATGATKALVDAEAKAKKEAEEAAGATRRFVEQTKQVNATPMERYEAAVKKARAAVDGITFTEKDLNRELARQKGLLNQAGQAKSKRASLATGAMGGLTRSLAVVGGSYVTLSGLVSVFNETLAESNALAKEAVGVQTGLAGAQQEAIKNLTGLTTAEKSQVLTRDVLDIQKKTGFRDQSKITEAIGAGFSASGDLERTVSATTAAARITPLTPNAIGAVSAGALDVARGSGITDAERNLGFLLSAGAINRIEDPQKLAQSLAPLVSSGVETVKGQDREEASREIGALFGVIARAATDTGGKPSGTATTILLAKMDQFFSTRTDDPGTIFGRIEAIGQSPELRQELLGDEGFGEARFKKAISEILTANSSLSKELDPAKQQVQFDAEIFRQTVEEIQTLTPQLKLAIAEAKAAANVQAFLLDKEIGQEGNARQILTDTLAKTRTGPLSGLDDKRLAFGFDIGMGGATVEERAISGLENRKVQILDGGLGIFGGERDVNQLSEKERKQLALIEEQTAILREILADNQRRNAAPARPAPPPSNAGAQRREANQAAQQS